ncbi:MAG TPA: hypothetical protein VF611_10445, partial [Pyrinomonadaceae bacterium]
MKVRAPFLSGLALCVACLPASAGAQQPGAQQTQQKPAEQTKPEPPVKKKNARPEGEAEPGAEPFDKMTPAQMGGRCVTLDTEAGEV